MLGWVFSDGPVVTMLVLGFACLAWLTSWLWDRRASAGRWIASSVRWARRQVRRLLWPASGVVAVLFLIGVWNSVTYDGRHEAATTFAKMAFGVFFCVATIVLAYRTWPALFARRPGDRAHHRGQLPTDPRG